MNKERIGQRIREERKRHKLTLDALAEIAGVGKIHLSQVERGQKMPSLNAFCKIVNAFGDVPADSLLRDYVEPGKPYVLNEVTEKMVDLPPHRVRFVADVVDALIRNFDEDDKAVNDQMTIE